MKSITFILAVILFAAFSSAFRLHSRLENHAEFKSKTDVREEESCNSQTLLCDGGYQNCWTRITQGMCDPPYDNQDPMFAYITCNTFCGE